MEKIRMGRQRKGEEQRENQNKNNKKIEMSRTSLAVLVRVFPRRIDEG